MNNFENLKSLSLESLATWLDINVRFDDSPWMKWFDKKYCRNCESIECTYVDYWKSDEHNCKVECAYCELEHKCRFFPDMEDIPDNRDIIELWLKENIDD